MMWRYEFNTFNTEIVPGQNTKITDPTLVSEVGSRVRVAEKVADKTTSSYTTNIMSQNEEFLVCGFSEKLSNVRQFSIHLYRTIDNHSLLKRFDQKNLQNFTKEFIISIRDIKHQHPEFFLMTNFQDVKLRFIISPSERWNDIKAAVSKDGDVE